jgi:NitT/TauT family transport system ATP-binding protein
MNFVDLDRVSLRYGEDGDGTLALAGTTLRVATGEFVAVVGPSGCGKSTLMKVVTGLWPPTAGTVIVSGREVAGPLSIVGMAFQNPTLLPWRTALDNVMLPLEIVKPHCSRLRRERAAYMAKARDLLALVGLAGFEDHFPWQLSGGMQQRASICRALVHDPKIMLMDEPFGALDAMTRERMNVELMRIQRETGKTVLLITHSIPEAVFLADRVLVMTERPGSIAAIYDVPLPRPRSLDAMADPVFTELVQRIRKHFFTQSALD